MGKGNPLSAVTKVFSNIGGAFMPKQPKLPKPPEIKAPTGPKQYSTQELQGIKKKLPGGLMAPSYLGTSEGMTDLQKRTAIATKAVSGGEGIDKAGLGYYRGLAYGNLGNNKAAPFTDIEKQFITQGLGEKIKGNNTEDYLSAIERAYRRM